MMAGCSRILIADDEPTARLLMRAALQKAGFDVVVAIDGEDALRQYRARPCDMVMLDVDMPGLNGFQACSALRDEAGTELPIVMVTGMDDTVSIEAAYEAGATDFISKPINWPLLGHRVKYLFRAYRALLALRAADARNAAILNAIPDTWFRMDAAGMVLDGNGAARAAGATPQAPRPRLPLSASYPPEIAAHLSGRFARARESTTVQNFDFQLQADTAEARQYEARLVTIEADEALCLVRDITERKQAEERIFRLAYFDGLTGLPNRQSFVERLEREVGRARDAGGRLAILFLDLDRFKSINDTMGHNAGDQLLEQAAERLRAATRPYDLVARVAALDGELAFARLGGDEFTVLLPRIAQREDAMQVAQRIREMMQQPFQLHGRGVMLTTSIGIAVYPDDGGDGPTLLKHADTAMYHAKDGGRDNCQFYSAALTQHAVKRMTLENNLRLAMERQEFFLVYQPQLELESGRIDAVEALIRWEHPEQGLIPPLSFIPLAEENGLIVRLSEWVLRTACRDAMRWLAAGHAVRVAVNLSPMQFRDPQLFETIRRILHETGLAPEWLELEVTESALMEDSEATLATLLALRDSGIRIALDDFGTGYSSLSYLKRLPLSKLKIDKSFIRGLPEDHDSLAIVRAIVALAKNLDFKVTAEGVETIEQARTLKSLGSETLQGFHISRPVLAGAIGPLLRRHWHIDAGG